MLWAGCTAMSPIQSRWHLPRVESSVALGGREKSIVLNAARNCPGQVVTVERHACGSTALDTDTDKKGDHQPENT